MRNLIGSLTGLVKKADPLMDPRATSTWMKEVRQQDVTRQLQNVQEVLKRLGSIERLNLANLHALLVMDDESQYAFDMLCQQYVQNPHMGKQVEEKLWQEIVTHIKAMLHAYHRFVRLEDISEGEEAGFQKVSALMLARGLRYIGVLVKWHLFRYETPAANLWSAANQFYRLSEVTHVDVDPVVLYGGQQGQHTSCADEYLHIQMLCTLNSGNFSIRQIEWADRWLGLWTHNIEIERKYRAALHQFCADLSQTQPAVKIHEAVQGEMLRFWGVNQLIIEITQIIQHLENGESPQKIGLGDDARMPGCLDFIRQLEIMWSREPSRQIQRSTREKVSQTVLVVRGLDSIFSAVRGDDERFMAKASSQAVPDNDEALDMRLYGYVTERTRQKIAAAQQRQQAWGVPKPKAPEGEPWVLENVSEGGFGANLPSAKNDWVRLFALLAVRNDDQSGWKIAVIRRLIRQNPQELYIGAQILTPAAVSVSLMPKLEDMDTPLSTAFAGQASNAMHALSALYIPYQSAERRANTILSRSSDYQLGKVYQATARDKRFMLRMGEVLEKGADWIWCVVNIVK
ncbi:hypothetical protein KSF73_10260 [Burkholderiaceae bacterium DAT-1]|nr:hypothetical protein [Burkholderiaceae bacterium DAT-1]